MQIVVLDMELEEQLERVRKRHGGVESAVEMAKVRGVSNGVIVMIV